MIYLTRRERFSSAHTLRRDDWDEAKNNKVYGKCSNYYGHGHNYVLFVEVKGKVNPETGFLVNLKDLSKVIKENVIEKLDHKNLNIDVDFLKGIVPTSENLAIAIWNQLYDDLKNIGCILHKVKLVETENNVIEYYGEE